MEKDTFLFQLSKELQYSKAGDFENTATIELMAPGMAEFDEAARFEQLVMGAFLSAGKYAQGNEKQEDGPTSTPKKEEIKMLLLAAQDVSLVDTAEAFKSLACKVASLDDSGSMMKKAHFDKMTRNDFIDMLCEYVAVFTFPSLFNGEAE